MKTPPLSPSLHSATMACVLGFSIFSSAWAAPYAWKINPDASSLTFNTTKSGAAGVGGVTETMQFTRFLGGIDSQGRIQFKLDLSSINSGIPIRDERMQSMLWNVGQYPSVTFSAQIPPELLSKPSDAPVILNVDGNLSMAGQTKPTKAQLQVVPLANGKLLVSTRKPILVKADEFGLTSGVEALRAIMGLNYLSSSAPVNLQLELLPTAMPLDL